MYYKKVSLLFLLLVLGKAEASAYLQVYSGSSSSLYSHNAG